MVNTVAKTPAVPDRAAPPLRTPIEENEVWNVEPSGTPWCDCGSHHSLTKERASELAREMFGDDLPERITHEQLINLGAWTWQYVEVCEFFLDRMRDSAIDVNGEVAADYLLPRGLAILRHFSNNWHGCPMEDCGGGYIPEPPVNSHR